MNTVLERSLNNVGLHHKVLIDEVSRVGIVGVDAADFGGSLVHLDMISCDKEGLHGGLVSLALLLESADNDAAGHAAVACDVDFFF